MSFTGFALKGKKKSGSTATSKSLSGFRVENVKVKDDSKEIVVGFSTSGDALLKDPSLSNIGPLVIPCINENWSADREAADALLEDIRTNQSKAEAPEESTLVIPVNGAKVNENKDGKKDAPMLTRNRVPGMENIKNDKDKFKHDLSMRPDELDIHSDAFEAVPIEEFGAALLRGMGWSGKDKVKPTGEKVQMRHHRLGLGATPKPVLETKKSKNYIPKPEPRERSHRKRSRSRSRSQDRKRRR